MTSEIVLYQPDDTIQLEVRLQDETVWLSQQQIAELFDSTIPNVSMHIRNVYKEGELDKGATVKDFLIVQNEGGRQVIWQEVTEYLGVQQESFLMACKVNNLNASQ